MCWAHSCALSLQDLPCSTGWAGWSCTSLLGCCLAVCVSWRWRPSQWRGPLAHQPFWAPLGPRRSQCLLNHMVANASLSLPSHHCFFLTYRHCCNFSILLAPSGCAEDTFLLRAIKSQPGHVEQCAAIRSTWGWMGGWARVQQLKLGFLLGAAEPVPSCWPVRARSLMISFSGTLLRTSST